MHKDREKKKDEGAS